MSPTRHRSVLETIGAGVAATALVAAPLIGIGSAAGAAVVGEVLSSTFEESVFAGVRCINWRRSFARSTSAWSPIR